MRVSPVRACATPSRNHIDRAIPFPDIGHIVVHWRDMVVVVDVAYVSRSPGGVVVVLRRPPSNQLVNNRGVGGCGPGAGQVRV